MGAFLNSFAHTLGGGQGTAPATGGPDGTQNYVEVTIAASQVGSTLTDFPVYVDLSDLPAAFFTGVQTDGGDIRVTESNGTTQAPVDLVSIDTGASTGELHFLASSLSSSVDTVYRIYYNASTTQSQPAVTGTYGRNAVWSTYNAVWHMNDTTDSTGTSNTLTAVNGATLGSTGNTIIGDSALFNSTSNYLDAGEGGGTLDAPTDFTASVWALVDSTASPYHIVGKGYYNGGSATLAQDSWNWVFDSSTNKFYAIIRESGAGTNVFTTTTVSAATWYLLHLRRTGSTISVCVNGSSEATYTSSTNLSNGVDLWLGAREVSGGSVATELNGNLDEGRFAQSFVSDAAMAAEYTNQNTPTTFYTIGTEQAA